MSEIGTAYVQIEPTAKGISGKIEKEMGGVGASSGTSFNKGFGSVLGTTGKLMAGAVVAGGAALTALGKNFVDTSAEVASYGDNIDKMSQKMGISAEAYQEWDAILQHSGTSMSSMGASFKKLAVASVDATDDQVAAFARVGISMEDLENGVYSQEEMFAKVIEGLQGMGEGALRTETATLLLGKGATELGALLNTSAADTEAMRQAVHDLGGVMSNDAVKAAAAYQDQLQDMQTAFQGLSRNMMSQFLPEITQVMAGLTDIFSGNSDKGIGAISEGIKGISEKISQAIPEVMSVATKIISAIADAFVQNMPMLAKAGTSMIQELAKGLLDSIPTAMPILIDVIESLMNMIILLAPQLVKAGVEIIKQLANGLTQAIPTLVPALTSVTVEILTMLTDPQMLTSLIQTGVDLILALIDGILQALPELTAAAPTIIQNLVSALTDALPALIDGCVQIVALLTQNIPQIIQGLIAASPQIIEALVVGLVQAAPGLIAAGPMMMGQLIIGLVQNLPQAFSFGKQLIDSIIEGLSSAKTRLTAEGPKVLTELYNRMSPEMKKFIQSGRELVQQIIQGVKGIANNLYNAGADLIKNLKAKITSTIKDFAQIGQNIVKGIKEGLEKAWEDVVKWFTDKINDLKKKVKDVLKIESPSKVFADEVGRMIPLGIAEGIEEGMGTLDNTVIGMAAGLPGTASDAMSASTYQADTSNSALYDLLAQYLPIIAQGENVNVILEADAGRMFRIMQSEQRKYTQLVGV